MGSSYQQQVPVHEFVPIVVVGQSIQLVERSGTNRLCDGRLPCFLTHLARMGHAMRR